MHVPITEFVKHNNRINPYAYPGLVAGSIYSPSIVIQPEVLCSNICKKACVYFGFEDMELLRSKARKRVIVEPRQMIVYYIRRKGVTLKAIGSFFNKDHTSILHMIGVVDNLKEMDIVYHKRLISLFEYLNSVE